MDHTSCQLGPGLHTIHIVMMMMIMIMIMQVSIAESPVTVVVKREAMSPAGEGRRDSSNRASIIQVTF